MVIAALPEEQEVLRLQPANPGHIQHRPRDQEEDGRKQIDRLLAGM